MHRGASHEKGFRVNDKAARRIARRKREIQERLDPQAIPEAGVFRPQNIRYEFAGRTRGMVHGGIGALFALTQAIGLDEAINARVKLLKVHRPYTEADHILNIAFNTLCDGTCLEDIELRRQDEVFLDALGAPRIPDPTTAGDFCRRFSESMVRSLLDAIDDARLKVWARQPQNFFDRATIDMDGSLVPTTGECKEGMDVSYSGVWGYHPLIVSLANTGEVLSLVNRSGNRPSHEGAAAETDRAIALCQRAGFRCIRLRGDTDFSQTKELDRWDAASVQFLFGLDRSPGRHVLADDLLDSVWKKLERPPRYEAQWTRTRPPNVKESVVVEREFKNLRLVSESVAACDYRPAACKKTYRLIIVRKNLLVTKGQQTLFADYRYHLYLTNIRDQEPAELVLEANDRCNQENLIAQLKSGVRALHAPVNTLVANWAYMVMAALAWNLKAWAALWLPTKPGRWAKRHRDEQQRVLKMEFKTFVNHFLRLPVQIVRQSRRLIYRVLGWNPWLPTFFRLTSALNC
jgi:hypothetical protein